MPRKIAGLPRPALFTGILYGLSFPPADFSPLAWIALVPLLRGISPDADQPMSPRAVAGNGFLAGWIANLFIFEWLWPTFRAAKIDLATTFLCWTLLSAVLAVYFCLFSLFYASIPRSWARPWLAAAAWVALEEARTVVLTGFPWALIAHTQVKFPELLQIASITGAGGVAFLMIAVNASMAEFNVAMTRARPLRGPALSFIGAAVLVAVTGSWGARRLAWADVLPARTIKVSLLQGNIDQYQKWDDAYEKDIRDAYGRLAEKAALEKPLLMVWPESSVPAWIPKDAFYTAWVTRIATTTAVPQMIGSLSKIGEDEYNSAFVVHENGQLEGQYDKRHLVPFGEYVPFGGLLKHVVPYLGQVGIFAAGKSAHIFEIDGVRFSPNICYEMIFPELVRRSARNADVIVNLTNDGWFLTSGAPPQHFAASILRAVENGRPVVRAANTGISALIDAFGQVKLRSPLMVEGAYTGELRVPPRDFRTIFGRLGNLFAWACCAVTLLWAVSLLLPLPKVVSSGASANG
ncbi:MAG: apolipoprotein N-acyltransferase [Elusimicrobia bacterium]|nr:apolipoprotein N-acyltransferase [Elusimicrobiota bacterium]